MHAFNIRCASLLLAVSMNALISVSTSEAAPDSASIVSQQMVAAAPKEDSGSSQSAPAPQAARTGPYLGAAPWICSPSGFGQRSKCFLRASLRAGRR